MDHGRLKVALDRKKAELKTLSDKLAKAEANRSPLATAGTLVRSSAGNEPIWVEGLHYPAQYLIRHTRSMSRHPTEFTLGPVDERECLEACIEHSDGMVCALQLLSAVLIGCNKGATILQSDLAVAVVWENAFTLLVHNQGPLRIVWQECLPKPECVMCLSCGGEEWILCLSTTVRAFLCSPFDMGRQCLSKSVLSLITPDPQVSYGPFSCGCCWYEAAGCFTVAAVAQSSLLIWTLHLDTHNQWTAELLSLTELTGSPSSVVHVQASQYLALITDTTLNLISAVECTMDTQSLVCSSKETVAQVSLVWATMKEGRVFFVLRAREAWSVLVLSNGPRELLTHQLNDADSCVTSLGSGIMQIQNSSDSLSIYTLNKLLFNARITGRGVSVCVWTSREHLLALTTSGFLCDFVA